MKRPAYLAILAALTTGCVVTPYGDVGDPPQAPAPPPPEPVTSSASGSRSPDGADGAEQSRPATIEASHILIAYSGATRASPTVTRSREEARARAEEALQRAQAGESLENLVVDYSDEPGAAQRAGALGEITRSLVVKPFGDAAFALDIGELSGIVETEFGYHIILRTR